MSATASAVVDLVFVRGESKPCAANASARASFIESESSRGDGTISLHEFYLVSDCDRHRLNDYIFNRSIARARGNILHRFDDVETFDNLAE